MSAEKTKSRPCGTCERCLAAKRLIAAKGELVISRAEYARLIPDDLEKPICPFEEREVE
jgi:hypothetical protein